MTKCKNYYCFVRCFDRTLKALRECKNTLILSTVNFIFFTGTEDNQDKHLMQFLNKEAEMTENFCSRTLIDYLTYLKEHLLMVVVAVILIIIKHH